MKKITELKKVVSDPYTYIRKYKKKSGKKVVGYFCSYAPEELIWAAGALPLRMFGTNENIHLADTHLQSYCCSLVRGGLEDALTGKLAFLDGTVFPHTCDSIQRLSDIWRLNGGFPFHLDVILPVKVNTASAREYIASIFLKFKTELGRSLGANIDDRLQDTIKLYNNVKRSLEEIYLLRDSEPGIISGSDVHAIIKSSMVMDRGDLLGRLRDAIEEMKAARPEKKEYKRIVLAGGVCNHPDIYPILEHAGARVVWDELCTGTRYFEGAIKESGDPLPALAARYAERIVCPAKHCGTEARGRNLVDLVKKHKAQGVVFLLLKFCDPHSYDYPYMKEFLDAEKVPNMLLEIEEQPSSAGQLATRFESFIEML